MNAQRPRTVFITGHTTPDTDSVCSAVAYASFRSQTDKGHLFTPVRADRLNHETGRREGVRRDREARRLHRPARAVPKEGLHPRHRPGAEPGKEPFSVPL